MLLCAPHHHPLSKSALLLLRLLPCILNLLYSYFLIDIIISFSLLPFFSNDLLLSEEAESWNSLFFEFWDYLSSITFLGIKYPTTGINDAEKFMISLTFMSSYAILRYLEAGFKYGDTSYLASSIFGYTRHLTRANMGRGLIFSGCGTAI